ncbi:hypothetical protein ACFOD0_16730 [Shewanella intestini]|uniref:Uncharacterized protein n=1 Tax=Shewanella intestini TaxID=2017544 RepID=A0ABS5I4I8_9GAMM|nr:MULTISPECIES: hypothetical protein [Shewanella]MBR9728934.1 hypothetical protein [Shewanella intestini]MRG37000.1 hypothetical protein [Shewanella sp. XMDDZSB0408]
MRGWIFLAIVAGILYFTATKTDKLDTPIAYVHHFFNDAEHKIDKATGTTIQRTDKHLPKLAADLADRLTPEEMTVAQQIFTDERSVAAFKQQYCQHSYSRHDTLSAENLQYICDQL